MVTLKKYHGLGNDYLIYDPNQNRELLQERQIQLLCRRNTGVGADGILSGPVFENEKIKVRILIRMEVKLREAATASGFFKVFERCRICEREVL